MTGYPPFRGSRRPVAEAAADGGGPVAGRLESEGDGLALVDASGRVLLAGIDGDEAGPGDWVSGRLAPAGGGRFVLGGLVLHAPRRAPSPDPHLAGRLPLLALRARLVDATRSWFRDAGFLEVETPARVACPGLEPHLRAFPAGGDRWLITSPELHLKRMVAAGAEKVVELARSFRDDESGPWHRSEFLMIEWYRAFEGPEALEADCESLISALAGVSGVDAAATLPGCVLTPPFDRVTVREALRERTGLDLAALAGRDTLADAVSARGHAVSPDDDWDDLFFRVWIAEVEPHLGRHRPVFVRGYPASQAALARIRRDDGMDVAERFELYVAGIELANAFHELNDPDEQRRRHEADREARRSAGAPVPPLDDAFLAALAAGMPPCSGIALGFDRLAALLLGLDSLYAGAPFPSD